PTTRQLPCSGARLPPQQAEATSTVAAATPAAGLGGQGLLAARAGAAAAAAGPRLACGPLRGAELLGLGCPPHTGAAAPQAGAATTELAAIAGAGAGVVGSAVSSGAVVAAAMGGALALAAAGCDRRRCGRRVSVRATTADLCTATGECIASGTAAG
nr:hypothetical protein [Tanacetum cinerariifolium]